MSADRKPASYRPDIDGLRAVAVLLVVGYHLGSNRFPGGFIGVDIFFVISGFLVTGIVHREMERGTFTFGGFYERRVRRIFPALAVMLLVTSVVGYEFLLPVELVEYGKSLAAAALSYANLYFFTQADYFKPDLSKPLLHTWSLSVEEMFYVVLPPLLLLLRRWGRRILLGMSIILGLSFVWAEWLVLQHNTSAAFFFPQTRAWELMAGSLLAVAPRAPQMTRALRELLGFLGLGLILAGNLLLAPTSPFPGATALLPVGGAVILIFVGSQGSVASSFLSLAPLRLIGLISYSVYLWHWPLIIFTRRGFLNLSDRVPYKPFIMILSLLIGCLSWWAVEQPFRSGPLRKMKRAQLFRFAGACVLVCLAISGIFLATHGLPGRYPPRAVEIASHMDNDPTVNRPCYLVGRETFADYRPLICDAIHPGARNYMLIGDSHSGALEPGLATLPNFAVLEASVAGGCNFVIGGPPQYPRCDKMRSQVYAAIPSLPVTAVIMVQRWTTPAMVESFRGTFAWFHTHHIALIVVGPYPEYADPLPLLLAQAIRKGDMGSVAKRERPFVPALDRWMAAHADDFGYTYLSAYDVFCQRGTPCQEFADKAQTIPVLKDNDHLTPEAAEIVAKAWAKAGSLP